MNTSLVTGSTLKRRTGKRIRLFYLVFGFALVLLVLLLGGTAYQTIATAQDQQAYSPHGRLYTVNGHQMHLVCSGSGSPTVILQAGGGAESLWWYRVQTELATHTHVCAYDRPGHGWSEPTETPRDALTIVAELRALLREAEVFPPYVVAGHSFGALWTRIYAAQYPEDVVGVALLDTSFLIPDEFTSQSEFDAWKTSNDQIQAVVRLVYQMGLIRLAAPASFAALGYSAELIPELTALRSPNHVFESDYREEVEARLEFTEAAAAARNLGDVPLAIVWASQSYTQNISNAAIHEQLAEMATYSSNSITRIIEGADHGSMLGSPIYAPQVTNAILEVLNAARTGELLAR